MQTSSQQAMSRSFVLACLLCAIPVLLPTYPPMVDLPQHAGQVAVLKSMLSGHGWTFESLFQIQPFTPYWLGYGLVMALSFPFGIVWALKLVIAAALCLFPWAAARFCNRMGADPALNWMLLVLPYGFAYQWGFLNFVVAAPFGFLFLSALLDLKGRSDWRACLRVALWLHFLFFAHVLTTAFFCMVAMLLLAPPWQGFREWMRRCLPVFTILPVTAAWLWTGLHGTPHASTVIWNAGWHRLFEFLPALVSAPTLPAGVLIGACFLLAPFLSGARPKRSWLAWTPFGLYAAWLLFFPHDPGGVAFAYERFGIFGLPLYLIGFQSTGKPAASARIAVLRLGLASIAIAMLGWQGIRALNFQAETAGYRAVMAHAQPAKRLMYLPLDRGSSASTAPLMLHFGSWYQAERGGLADFSFAQNWMQPLQYRKDHRPAVVQYFEWFPDRLDWAQHRGDAYDYLLIRHPADAADWLRQRSGGAMIPLARSGEWQLYGRNRGHE